MEFSGSHHLQQMTQEEEQIIEIVVVIFQNVGIKRSINHIEILKNYQIYFQICKVIFPETMIELFRISQKSLTGAQKIQGVIKIVGNILQNDLYHISGQEIANGSLNHIKNFLHILELLSENVNERNKKDEEVESAPQNTKSISDYDQEGHYTVIGISKEFARSLEDEEINYEELQYDNSQFEKWSENGVETRRENPVRHRSNQKKYKSESEGDPNSEEEFDVMGPKLQADNKPSTSSNTRLASAGKRHPRSSSKKKSGRKERHVKFITPLDRSEPARPVQYDWKPRARASKPHVRLEDVLREPEKERQARLKTAFMKKINQSIQSFEVNKLRKKELDHNQWVRKHLFERKQKQNQIVFENRQRIEFTNQLIENRQSQVASLRGENRAVKEIGSLFREQKAIMKGIEKAKKSAQMRELERIIEGHYEDESLLRDAIVAEGDDRAPTVFMDYGRRAKVY